MTNNSLDHPDPWEDHGIDGARGISKKRLAKYLGCSIPVLKPLLGEPIGRAIGVAGRLYNLYDIGLATKLADHPDVVASRERSARIVTHKKRASFLVDLVNTWEYAGAELIGVSLGNHKSVDDLTLELGDCTVLIGRNGSGKTNILEALSIGGGVKGYVDRLRAEGTSADSGDVPTWWIYRLAQQAPGSLDEFLTLFVRGRGTEGESGEHLRSVLAAVLTRPVLYVAHGEDSWLGADDVAVEAASSAGERLYGRMPSDWWIQLVVGSLRLESSGLRSLARLPTRVKLSRPRVELVDPDPVRLGADLTDDVVKVSNRLWEPIRPPKPNVPLWFEVAKSSMAATGRGPEVVDGLPWLSWLSEAGVDGVLPEAIHSSSQPDASQFRLSDATGATRWLGRGKGQRHARSIIEFAEVARRREVEALIARAAAELVKWLLGVGNDPEDLQRALADAGFLEASRSIEMAYRGLGFSVAGSEGVERLTEVTGNSSLSPEVTAVLRMVEDLANRLAPPFVKEQGRIVLNPAPAATWSRGAPRFDVRFAQTGTRFFDVPAVGRGAGRWIAASIREAIRYIGAASLEVLDQETIDAGDPDLLASAVRVVEGKPEMSVLLVDEPEMSLHPEAQEQVAAWCVAASRLGQKVIVATHSPAMLDLPPREAKIVGVSMVSGDTRVVPLEMATLEGLDKVGDLLGLGRPALLQLIRGFVLVEGTTDARILDALLGKELKPARVVPIPLHGYFRAEPLFAQPELLAALGRPVAILFDDVRREVLDGSRDPSSNEEQYLLRLREHRHRFADVYELSFDAPDIICALPDDAIRRVEPGFAGWEPVLESWDRETTKFKLHVLRGLGRPEQHRQIDALVRSVLKELQPDDKFPKAFVRTAQELRAWAHSIGSDGPGGP